MIEIEIVCSKCLLSNKSEDFAKYKKFVGKKTDNHYLKNVRVFMNEHQGHGAFITREAKEEHNALDLKRRESFKIEIKTEAPIQPVKETVVEHFDTKKLEKRADEIINLRKINETINTPVINKPKPIINTINNSKKKR